MLDVVLAARQWVFPAVVAVVASGRPLLTLPAVALAAALAVAWRVVAWSRFSYRIEDDALRIEQGVLQRHRREVPIARIQQVDLQRKLRHRLLGVAVVRIDTAGSGSGAEVVLEALADHDALALRSALLSVARSAAAATGAPALVPDGAESEGTGPESLTSGPPRPPGVPAPTVGPPETVARLGTRDLVVAGITGSRLGAAFGLAAAALAFAGELPGDVVGDAADRASGDVDLLVPALLLLAVPLVLVVAAATSVLTDHDFTLVRVGGDLHLRRGLLDQREATLPLHRVQVVRILDNPLRRALGLSAVQLQSAGSGTEAEGEVTRLTIPLVRRADLDRTVGSVLPGAAPLPALTPAPRAARRRAWIRRLAPVTVVAALLAVAVDPVPAAAVLLLALPAAVLAESFYRSLGHAEAGRFVVARQGAVLRETAVVPVARTQSTRLSTSWLQRRAGLATLHLDVAGRGRAPEVHDGDAGLLRALRRTGLYAAEARADEAAVRRRLRGGERATAVPG